MTTKILETVCIIDVNGRKEHIRAALSRGLPVCTKEEAHGRKVAIVAAGPSVRDFAKEILDFDGDVWCINRAYDYVKDVIGRVPEGFVGLDPQAGLVDSLIAPNGYTAFYIASCCHPAVFDRLAGYKVSVWHSDSDTREALPSGSYAVPGGITCVTRAPFLAYLLGYRDVTIFGADCSYDEQPYVYATDSRQCDPKDQTRVVRCGGRLFRTELGLMHQASNLGALEVVFPAKLTFRCGGLLPAFLSSTRPLGDFIANDPA